MQNVPFNLRRSQPQKRRRVSKDARVGDLPIYNHSRASERHWVLVFWSEHFAPLIISVLVGIHSARAYTIFDFSGRFTIELSSSSDGSIADEIRQM